VEKNSLSSKCAGIVYCWALPWTLIALGGRLQHFKDPISLLLGEDLIGLLATLGSWRRLFLAAYLPLFSAQLLDFLHGVFD